MTDEDELEVNIKKMKTFSSNNTQKLVAIGMLIFAIAGMWFCWKVAYMRGSIDICENSNGIPVVPPSNDIKDSKCLIMYDPLTIHDNNLNIPKEEIDKMFGG